MRIRLGRHVLGLGAIIFGVVILVWHDFAAPWQQVRALGNVSYREHLVFAAAVIEILGGLAIQWRGTARSGAAALGLIYFIFALLWVPIIISAPGVYDGYGNFFEQFSMVSGALIVFGTVGRGDSQQSPLAARIGYFGFGICVISFTLEQLFFLSATASFVPKWIPPGQMFWAIATTIFFALAAIALLSRIRALLAARLLTAMIIGFQLLIWIPAVIRDPHQLINWGGNAQNLGIAGASWIVADFLTANRAANRHGEADL